MRDQRRGTRREKKEGGAGKGKEGERNCDSEIMRERERQGDAGREGGRETDMESVYKPLRRGVHACTCEKGQVIEGERLYVNVGFLVNEVEMVRVCCASSSRLG